MKQFFNWTDDDFTALERQARSACVVFSNQELPVECMPTHHRVGISVDPKTGRATLFVDLGVHYTGRNETVRQWLENGELSFPTFGQLRSWITTELKAEFSKECPNIPSLRYDQHRFILTEIATAAAIHGLILRHIDTAVPRAISVALGTEGKQPSPTNIADLLSGAFCAAAAQGYEEITIHPGPAIICKPIPQKP